MAPLPMHPSAAAGRILIAAVVLAGSLFGQNRHEPGDWDASPGCDVQVDAAGLADPVAIAVVTKPGTRTDDPSYFVAERGGRVKVVTNDRDVKVFADVACTADQPDARVEVQDLALAPEHGCLFVSFRSGGANGPLAGDLLRMECAPGRLSDIPCHRRSLRKLLDRDPAFARCAFGPLAVLRGALFVGVEDLGDPRESQDLDAPSGKVLRMDLDGLPLKDNPFYTADGNDTVRDYVWAFGLRCPDSLVFADEALFVSDRGLDFNRLLQVRRGSDYNFDGSRWSLGIRPDAAFGSALSPVRMAFVPGRLCETPDTGGTLLVALGGADQITDAGPVEFTRTIVSFALQPGSRELTGKATPFLSGGGRTFDVPRDVAVGQHAIFVVIGAGEGEVGAVLKISYGREVSLRTAAAESPSALIASRGCHVCHETGISDAVYLRSLDAHVLAARLMKRLHSEAYLTALDKVDELREPPFETYSFARSAVRESVGMARVRTWLRYKLAEPRFDAPGTAMPNHGLTNEQAAGVVEELLHDLPETAEFGLLDRVRLVMADLVPHPRQRHLLYFLLGGCLVGCVATIVFQLLRKRLKADRPEPV